MVIQLLIPPSFLHPQEALSLMKRLYHVLEAVEVVEEKQYRYSPMDTPHQQEIKRVISNALDMACGGGWWKQLTGIFVHKFNTIRYAQQTGRGVCGDICALQELIVPSLDKEQANCVSCFQAFVTQYTEELVAAQQKLDKQREDCKAYVLIAAQECARLMEDSD